MTSLKEAALSYKGSKELFELPKLSVDVEIKTDFFDGKQKDASGNPLKVPYNYIEIEGWKYTIKANLMKQIKYLLEQNPNMKFFKFVKAPDGTIFVMAAD